VLDLSNFSWRGRFEVPKAPMGQSVPSPVCLGRGQCPSPENFLVFDLKVVNFGLF